MFDVMVSWVWVLVAAVAAALIAAEVIWKMRKIHGRDLNAMTREMQKHSQDHELQVQNFKSIYIHDMTAKVKEAQGLLDQQTSAYTAASQIRNGLLETACPFAVLAARREGSPEGDAACRFLYMMSSLGVYNPNKDTIRHTGRGQMLIGMNPPTLATKLSRVLNDLQLSEQDVLAFRATPAPSVPAIEDSPTPHMRGQDYTNVKAQAEEPLVRVGQGTSETTVMPSDV